MNFVRLESIRKQKLRLVGCALMVSVLAAAFVPLREGQAEPTSDTAPEAPAKKAREPRRASRVCAACIRGHMEFLASDALQGRGSGSHDELLAATYIASEMRAYGIEPAGDDGGYIESVNILRRKVLAPPQLMFEGPGGASAQQTLWKHGDDFLALYLTQSKFSGPLQKINIDREEPTAKAGAVVLLTGVNKDRLRNAISRVFAQGATGALVPLTTDRREHWHEIGQTLPELPVQVEGEPENGLGENFNVLSLSDEAQQAMQKLADGIVLHFDSNAGAPEKSTTWNALGILRGRDPEQQKHAILLSAHLDHLGIGQSVNGDAIYNGADDDASGTSAVLELARVLGTGPRPRRTVIFALFGSEETGGLGSTYFREHPPVPLRDIVANLEFEMIGRPDPKLEKDTLWLSGWERSNLGPELALHGAKLVGDPHPEQGFFRRSDNYVLAKKGVVAQTISSFGLHKDYHQPSDDLAHIDFQHMTTAIGSLIGPVEWLVNSDFIPKWKPGGQP
jgi:aminopeptidase YwaD